MRDGDVTVRDDKCGLLCGKKDPGTQDLLYTLQHNPMFSTVVVSALER